MNYYEVIMFNMSSYSEWQNGVVNRNYHIFNYLLQDKKIKRIIAVDFLPFTVKRAIRNYWENIIKAAKGKVVYMDLTTKCVRIIDKNDTELYIFSTIDSIFSCSTVVKKLNKILKIINNQSTANSRRITTKLIYSCFPMFIDYFFGVKTDLTVFDAVDNWIEHPSFIKYQNVLKKNYKIISEKSDLIFTVSKNLKKFFQKLGRNKNLYWIPNGVDVNHFVPGLNFKADIAKNVLKPIIGYLGTIQNRFDVELLGYLAKNNPKKSFVLVGPIWQSKLRKIFKKHKNIYLTGRVSYFQAPDYVNCFDVAIIPHKLNKFTKSTYSLKLLEYLSCGKPVVATPNLDTEKFRDVIYRASNYEDFNKKINLAIKENGPLLAKQRVEMAKKEAWKTKIDEMMERVDNFN